MERHVRALPRRIIWVFLSVGAACVMTAPGCEFGSIPRKQAKRTEQLSSALSGTGSLTATTHNGSITVRGEDTQECKVTALISAWAATEEEAQQLAEEVKVTLERSADALTVKIDKPTTSSGESISVNLDIMVPRSCNLDLTTHNGPIQTSDISGEATCESHNGPITGERMSGDLRLTTHNGAIVAGNVSGNLQAETHNGRVKASYAEQAPSAPNVSITTHNGEIRFTPPKDFSASVTISVHNGAVSTDLPLTVVGEVTRQRMNGTIGNGEGRLELKSHNGSIKIQK